jgi:hypothetical protein
MIFNLFTEDEVFITEHFDVLKQKLTTALTLFVQQMQEDIRRRTTPIGKGISGDASIETANVQERLRQEHERQFGTEEQRRQQVKEMQNNIGRNTMLPREK